MDLNELLARPLWGNTLERWALGVGLAVLVTLGLRWLARFGLRRVEAFAARTANDIDDLAVELLDKTRTLAILLVGLWVGARTLELPPRADQVMRAVLVVGVLLQAGYWGMGVINYLVKRWKRRQLEDDPGLATAVGAVGFLAKLLLWSLLLLTALDNLGVDVTAFVASLGIGGVAVALALQNVLGDLFASLSIVMDKPFVIGDFIVVGDFAGTVEHVGLKTTRIRSLSGEQLVFSNSDLLSSRIRNYKRMQERRVAFEIGVTYDTTPDQLRSIPATIRAAIESLGDTARFDRSHFKAFGDSSLNVETVYFVTVPDYEAYMDAQQAVNLRIMESFAEDGVEFAFPSRTVYLVQEGEGR